MNRQGPGFMVYLRKSMLYLTSVAEDGLTPTGWHNTRESAFVIRSIKQAYAIANNINGRSGNCMIMSVDRTGRVKNCTTPSESPIRKFDIKIIFSNGGSVKTEIKAMSTEHAIMKSFRDVKNKKNVSSIELTPKIVISGA